VTVVADDLLVAAAAGGLPGSLREFPEAPLPEARALEVVDAAERFGIAGFLLAAVRSGDLSLAPVAVDALVEARSHESTTRLYLEQELQSVSGLLEDAEIESRVLGGCAAAHLDYRDREVRAVRRLDLLVPPRTLGRAAEVLRRRGWRPPKAPDGQAVGGVELVGPSGPRLVIDDDLGIPGTSVDSSRLWADGDPFSVSGRKLKALGSEQRLLHTAVLALDPDESQSLVPQRDLVEMVLFGEWRRARLMDLAAAWNAEDTLARAVRASWQRLAIADVTGLSVWAEGYRPEARKPRRYPAGAPAQPTRSGSWWKLRTRLANNP
jgi:hypothetical protein